MGNAEWCFFEAVGASRLPPCLRVAPYRMAGGMPLSDALRRSLGGQGSVYQYAARFSSPVFLLVSVWLAPTASFCNRIMIAEVIARAMEAGHRQMRTGPYESGEVKKYENGGAI